MNSLTNLKYGCDLFVVTMVTILGENTISENKESSFSLKYALRKEFSFKCLSVMICEQFVVSIVELQSVSWSLAEFRHNKIVQSPHENYFNVCRQHKEK